MSSASPATASGAEKATEVATATAKPDKSAGGESLVSSTATIIAEFCYPTLVIVPVAISIVILIFAELTLFYKMAVIFLLILTMFMYISQQTKLKVFTKST